MTWDDCLYLGRQSVYDYDYDLAFLWLKEALSRLPHKTSQDKRAELYIYLRTATYIAGLSVICNCYSWTLYF